MAPVRRRRSPHYHRQAAIPIVVPTPAAFRVQSIRHQIPAPPADGAVAADAGNNLLLLAHTALSQAEADAEASPPPAPTCKKLCSSRTLRLPVHASSSLGHGDTTPRASRSPPHALSAQPHASCSLSDPPLSMDHLPPPEQQLPRAVVPIKKRRSLRIPKPATIPRVPTPAALPVPSAPCQIPASPPAAAEAADAYKLMLGVHTAVSQADVCPQTQGNAGSSKGDQGGGGVASPAAAASPMQLGDEDELEPGEIPPEKPADFALGSALPLDKEEETAVGEEEEEDAKKTTIAGEPAAETGSSEIVSAMELKRKREVFVCGLSRDAKEEDIRAALSAAGEITHVRMIRDRTGIRNHVGYCFVAFRDAAMASKAVADFGNVKICGKPCHVAASKGNEKTNRIAQRDPIIGDFNGIYGQRQPPTQAVHSSYISSWGHHASYAVSPLVAIPAGYYYPMYHNNGDIMYLPPPDLNHGQPGPSGRSQMRQSGSSRPGGKPHRSRN